MSNLTKVQLDEIAEIIDELRDEFKPMTMPELSRGMMRLVYDAIEKWHGKQGEDVIEDRFDEEAQAYKLGFEVCKKEMQFDIAKVRNEGYEAGYQAAYRLNAAVEAMQAEQAKAAQIYGGEMLEVVGIGDDPLAYSVRNSNGVLSFATTTKTNGSTSTVIQPERANDDEREMDSIDDFVFFEPGNNELVMIEPGDDLDEDEPVETQEDLIGDLKPRATAAGLHRAAKALDESYDKVVAATLGPEHTLNTPLRPIADILGRPIGRDHMPRTLAEVDEDSEAYEGELDMDLEPARSKHRSPTVARTQQLERLKRERKLAKEAERKTRGDNKVVPTLKELVTELQRQAMGGVMPTRAFFDDARPATWATAQAHILRLEMTWSDLAKEAGLKPNRVERAPSPVPA